MSKTGSISNVGILPFHSGAGIGTLHLQVKMHRIKSVINYEWTVLYCQQGWYREIYLVPFWGRVFLFLEK